ncbi:glycosyltransferase involved in cell wall biosynthesis [Flavobacterium sp. 103]|uniref:glycosyltransferase family 2 protein n=1 Tax=Flavobacterium sp. 103 TaxID=2135624 RepID=UPI000D5D092A|nr:glycosyltransferase family 2 protein [Flavobacterium sp. 103]PVX47065.1 glycosyltransferase involved in cell wall biosynthesis [Flavobacterium sp. 103]
MTNSNAKKLSVLIITLNEEEHLKALLSDLDFADEIIIVDSFSTDGTEIVAKTFPKVTFTQNKFENFSAQRNFAISQAKNDWILFLDADEVLTPELKQEIIETLQNNQTYVAYFFERIFMFENTVLKYSGNQTDKIFRLFDKKSARYDEKRLVHEKLIVNGEIGFLKNKLIHHSYSSYQDYREKIIFYGKFKAQEKFIKKVKPTVLNQFFHPSYNFLYNYFIRLGILDGKKGIIICYLNAYSIVVRYKELKKLWKQNPNLTSKT